MMCDLASVVSGGGAVGLPELSPVSDVVAAPVEVPAVPAAMMIAKARDSRSIDRSPLWLMLSTDSTASACKPRYQGTGTTASLTRVGRRVLIIA